MNTKPQSGLEEATSTLKHRFNAPVSRVIPESFLNIHASTPWPNMRTHQALVTLSALEKTKARVATIATSAGFIGMYAPIWADYSLAPNLKWRLAFERRHHLPIERLSELMPSHIGGLSNYADLRKKRILALWRKIAKNPNESRLQVLDMADHRVSESQLFGELIWSAEMNERIGLVPCPYCSYRQSAKAGERRFVSHWLKGSFGICIENWHGKCPMRRVLCSMISSSLAEVIRETGLALTGRFSMRWFSKHLPQFDAKAILIKDYAVSAGALKAAAEALPKSDQLLVGTRTICNLSIKELESLPPSALRELVDRHPILSDGTEFVC